MRPVYLLHDAALLARMVGVEAPCCAQVAMPTQMSANADSAHAWGAFIEANPLSGDWIIDTEAPSRRTVSWSGTLADELFADEPRTWMKTGQARFQAFLDEITPALHHHQRTLCLRPHHRHVVGDVHASVKLLRERAGGPFEILLSPGDLLAPSMLAQLEDHLIRMFTHLGPVASAVLLIDMAPTAETPVNGLLSPCRAGEGVLPLPLLAKLIAEYVPEETPVILLPGAMAQQRGALGL